MTFFIRGIDVFWVPGTGDTSDFFCLKNYGNGPDPVAEIGETKDLNKRRLAEACLFIRERVGISLNDGVTIKKDWPRDLTSENLAGWGSLTSACLGYLFRENSDRSLNLVSHSICNIFPDWKGGGHVFQIAEINERWFIVDLTFRQFIDDNLRLKKDEASVIDSLLKDGFVEIKEGELEVYYRFFQSCCHRKGRKAGFNNYSEWDLCNTKAPPLSVALDVLSRSNYVCPFKADEIKSFLGMKKK